MSSQGARFVYAVCGPDRHVSQLNASLELLKHHSRRDIVVVTDSRRTTATIHHDQVVDVETPADFDDRRAAIDLKTRLHRIVGFDRPGCYLDSDVIAVSPRVDDIFDHYRPPVTFAADLPTPDSNLKRFSRYALECPCQARYQKLERYFATHERFETEHLTHVDFERFSEASFYDGAVFDGRIRRRRWWTGRGRGFYPDGSLKYEQEFERGEQVRITYHFPDNPWRWVKEPAYEPAGLWRDDEGHSFRWIADEAWAPGGYWLDQDGDSFRLKQGLDGSEVGFWYRGDTALYRLRGDVGQGEWIDEAGNIIPLECDHLAVALEDEFGITIRDRGWVNWNGGVFLFGPESAEFLDDWHTFALRLIRHPGWSARDQAALVAAAWKHGLEGHPLLPQAFNRIVDHRAADSGPWLEAVQSVSSGSARFLHMIHGGIGDRDWPPWQAAARTLHRPI